MKEPLGQQPDRTVLLIRVNSSTELLNTSWAVDQVRQDFPQSRLVTLATPQTETRTLLETDRRFAQVLLFPDESKAQEKSPAAFRRFMARWQIASTIVCFGATTGFDYSRHLLSILLCPGRRYFLDGQGRRFPVGSPQATLILLKAALSLGARKVIVPALRTLAHRRQKPEQYRLSPESIRRILVIRLDHIGDLALSLPAIHALKNHFAQAQVDALVSSASAPLLQDVAEVTDVMTCDLPRFSRGGGRQSVRQRLALMRRLRRSHYDLAIDLRGDDASRLWAVLGGAKRRAGLDYGPYEPPNHGNLSPLLTHPISAETAPSGQHAAEASLALVRRLGVCVPDVPYRLAVAPDRAQAVTRERVERGIPDAYAILHIRPGNPAKVWSAAAFAAVADHLIEAHHMNIVLSGAPDDSDANEQVLALMRNKSRAYNAAGLFSLGELPALFQQARIMVTVDTGPMHIAAAVGTPIVALFLPWTVSTFYPYGQLSGVVTPSPQNLRRLEETGRLWEGSLLEAIQAAEVCESVDRTLEGAYV